MGQLGFFDADKRLEALSAKGDPLEAIDHLVPWESFRAEIEAVVLTPDELKKSSAGRNPFDAILMFRCRRSGTVVRRTPSCRLGARQRGGSRSPPKCGRRTAMRAGPRSMAAASSATRT